MNRKQKANNNKNKITMYNETLYQVQKVVQVKWVKNRQFCYIKWKGYDQTFNTWEPKQHITFCYQECRDQEKDDDPQYTENVPCSSPSPSQHTYHTRAKRTNRSPSHDKLKHITEEEHQESPEVQEIQTPQRLLEITKLRRPLEPPNSEQLELTNIQDSFTSTPNTAFVNSLLRKVIGIWSDESKQKKVAKVELTNGRISKVQYNTLKKRFPQKLIEFYEEELRSKTCKFD